MQKRETPSELSTALVCLAGSGSVVYTNVPSFIRVLCITPGPGIILCVCVCVVSRACLYCSQVFYKQYNSFRKCRSRLRLNMNSQTSFTFRTEWHLVFRALLLCFAACSYLCSLDLLYHYVRTCLLYTSPSPRDS